MKTKYLLPLFFLTLLLVTLIPHQAQALTTPPVDMFQLPWDLGNSWIAMDGFDNGSRRENTSPHNYNQGGAIDFAPHIGMKIGEDTSNAWVTAAAAGTVIATSSCHVKIGHVNGWTTEYYHLGNIQVKLGSVVTRNQRMAVIDNNEKGQVCAGNRWPGPHLHFVLRPNMRDATLAGWKINYDQASNITTFSKKAQTIGLFQLILNDMTNIDATTTMPIFTPTPTFIPTFTTPTDITPLPYTFTPTEMVSSTPIQPTAIISATPELISPTPAFTPAVTASPTYSLPTNLYVITVPSQTSILMRETSQIRVYLNNIPPEGLASIEFTCKYDPYFLEASSIMDAGLFGADAAMAMNDPQNGSFIVAIAGSIGMRAAASGAALTFNVKGIYPGQSIVECKARISQNGNTLVEIPSISGSLNIYDITPTPTASPLPQFPPVVTGQVFTSKPVIIRLYAADNALVNSITANTDGTFRFTSTAGTYTITASAEGFLSAQGTAVLTDNFVASMSTISLPAGDIDSNGTIDQYDAMTIGMSYNTAFPAAADLNNDGGINVLDLELLANNYRKSGALMWQ